jgi:ribosome-associated translation inhibitor RaiA
MKKRLELVIRNVDNPADVEALIFAEVSKLETMCDSIIKGRVLVEKSPKHLPSDNQYSVHIQLQVPPNYDIVVKREPSKKDESDSVFHFIHEGFDAAERQLKKIMERRHPKQREKRKKDTEDVIEESTEAIIEE